ncbi:MAG TPA: hypothetical protein VJ183_20050 [Chloroflexia bacterium]|nr:hypothetical protein [Chloroflexia bacterium]
MSRIMDQLVRYLDLHDLDYQRDDESDVLLLAGISTPGGDLDVAVQAEGETAVLVQVLHIETILGGEEEVLAILAWHLPQVNLAYDPIDGELCARLLVPVSSGKVNDEIMTQALRVLLSYADLARTALRLTRQGLTVEVALDQALTDHARALGSDQRKPLLSFGDDQLLGTSSPVTPDVTVTQAAGNLLQEEQSLDRPLFERTQHLLTGLAGASDREAFVREHLDEFDDEILTILVSSAERAQQQGQNSIADGLQLLIGMIQAARLALNSTTRREMELLYQLLEVPTPEALAVLIDTWPEVLAHKFRDRVASLHRTAVARGELGIAAHLEELRRWIESEQMARPLHVALLTLMTLDHWEDTRRAAQADTQLHSPTALAALADLATRAASRGDESRARAYLEHQERLNSWQQNNFAPDHPEVEDNPNLAALPHEARSIFIKLLALANQEDLVIAGSR